MKRPLADFRPIGPVYKQRDSNYITVSDLAQMSSINHYNPIKWAGKTPNRLYHNTDEAGMKGILSEQAFSTGDVFLGASVGEVFGDFTLVFDGETAVDEGFSPRTFLIDEQGEYKDYDNPNIFKTDQGAIWNERLIGCYPEDLWDSFEYPNAGSRCNPNLEIPFDVYTFPFNVFGLEPSGTTNANEPPIVNLSGVMQETFVLANGEQSLSTNDIGLQYIMYTDEVVNDDIAEDVAKAVGVEVITNEEAISMFPELTSDEPTYNLV